jgi:hypothetical protein
MSAVLKQVEIPVTDLVTINPATGKAAVVLTVVQRANVALDSKATEKRLTKLVKQSVAIQAITNNDGRAECHSAYMVLRNTRVELARTGKSARDDAQAFAKAVIKEEDRLIALISPEEKRLLELRDGYDEKCRLEEEERIAKEIARTAAIQARIAAIGNCLTGCEIKSSKEIETLIASINAIDISDKAFEEFIDGAAQVKAETKIAMDKLLMDAIEREDEEAARLEALAAENARMEAVRKELRKEEEASAARMAAAKAELDAANALLEAQKAEMQRQMAEMNRQREEMAQQQEALRAELRRQQDALNPPAVVEETLVLVTDPIIIAQATRTPTLHELLCKVLPDELMPLAAPPAPTAEEMILVIAECWDVSQDEARAWLVNTNFSK